MPSRIPHLFEDGVEKKICSNCKEAKDLDYYYHKRERWDGLSNECLYCHHLRNKRRCNKDYYIKESEFKLIYFKDKEK